jgi:flagellar biosynthesis chaperone FliJ
MSLKRIVEYRRHIQEQAREELLSVTQAFAVQLNASALLEVKLERILEKIAGTTREAVPAEEALAVYRLAEGLSADLATARRLSESLTLQKHAKQRSQLSAARDCRMSEKLDARRDREHLIEKDRKEQKLSDEASVYRWLALAETGRQGQFLPEESNRSSSTPSKQAKDAPKKPGGSS